MLFAAVQTKTTKRTVVFGAAMKVKAISFGNPCILSLPILKWLIDLNDLRLLCLPWIQ